MTATYGFAMLPNPYPNGLDATQRSFIVEGQLLPVETDVQKISNPSAFAIATNVLTFTIPADIYTHGGGDLVVVFGATGALSYLNGTYTSSSATASTLVVPLTHADVASTNLSGVTIALAAEYATGGLALSGFVLSNLQPAIIGGIGPLQVNSPKFIEVFTLKGSAENYKVDYTGTSPKILQFTGITQTTNAAIVASDMIGFRAEYLKNAF